jgi:hypothetical protein
MPISRTHRPLVANASGNTVDTEANTVADLLGLSLFSDIGSKPTTLAGYGITDAASNVHSHTLDDISDVVITAAVAGDLLRHNGTNWVDYPDSNFAASVHTHSASDITSGVINHARLGTGGGGSTKFLREDGTWQTVSGGGPLALDDLTDVTLSSPAVNDILLYNDSTSQWENFAGFSTFASSSHTHTAADITSGTINPARLGSGGGGATKFLREDNTWQTISGGGSVNSVSGTTDRITISGTAADPIVDIAATYVGQNTITTLGTITTGVWNGTAIASGFLGAHNHAAGDITSGILATARGGTGIAFFTAAGPTVARTYTFPDANTTILTTNAAVTVAQGGTGVATFTTNGVVYGNAAGNLLVTAQGGANSVLTANAGAPSFSSTPRLDRLGLGQAADASAVMAATGQYFSAYVSGVAPGSVDFNGGNVQQVQLVSGANTVTVSNPKSGGRYVLLIKQPAGGAAGTVTWPSTFKWSAGTAPTLTATNNLTDVITLVYNGTNFVASCALNFNV